jgi:hypothetical protein
MSVTIHPATPLSCGLVITRADSGARRVSNVHDEEIARVDKLLI